MSKSFGQKARMNLILLLACWGLVLGGVGLGYWIWGGECPEVAPEVSCPTEDSCTLDFRDGQWHVTPTVP